MARLWVCPECATRCIAKNREAHLASDFCKAEQARQVHEALGHVICLEPWISIVAESGVTMYPDIIRLTGGRRYECKAIRGYWIAFWVGEYLTLTGNAKSPKPGRAVRVRILRYLNKAPMGYLMFHRALDLAGWEATYRLLRDESRYRMYEPTEWIY